MANSLILLSLLVRQRGRLLWNRVTRGRRRARNIVGAIFVTLFSIGFVVVAGLNAGLLVDRIAVTDPATGVRALPLLLTAMLVLTFVTSINSAFHHLFMAGDLELLLAAPVPSGSLFGLKVLEIWRDSLHVILFEAAALYGIGQAFRLAPGYYVSAAVIGLLLTLSASAVGAIVALALARVRFGESILGISRILAILLLLPVGVLGVPALGTGRNRISLLLNQPSVNSLANQLRGLGDPPAWAPTTWAAHVLLGDEFAVLSVTLLVATAVVVAAATQLAFTHMFQGGWERVRFSTGPAARRVLWRLSIPPPGGPISSVLLKDWRTIVRDPRWRTSTVITIVALGFPAIALFEADPLARSPHILRFWFGLLPVPYLAFLVGSQQGAATLAYEGRNLALLRAAPVGMLRVVAAKVVGGLSLVLLVTWTATLILGLGRGGEPIEVALALVLATWLALGSSMSAVSGAALTADFESDNPQRRVGCLGTIVTSGLAVLFFVANVGLIAWWVARGSVRIPQSVSALVDLVLPVAALLSAVAIAIAAWYGVRRLSTWEAS